MRRIIQCLSIFLLSLPSFAADTQSSPLTEVLREEIPLVYFLSWGLDSREFFFSSSLAIGASEIYYRVELPEGDVEQVFESPWQDALHIRDLYALQSLGSSNLTYHSVAESPNEEWVVMSLSPILPLEGENANDPALFNMYGERLPYLTLLHHPSGEILQTDLLIRVFGSRPIIHWSEDSSTFVVSDTPGTWVTPTIFHYVTNLADGSDSAVTIEDISTVTTIDKVYNTYRLYDVSIDGEYVLLLGKHSDSASSIDTRHALLWSASTHTATILEGIDAYGVLTAAFAPESNTKLHFLTETGLIEYDTITHQASLVREDINTQRFNSVHSQFSPDGRYLALVEQPYARWATIYYVAYPFADH